MHPGRNTILQALGFGANSQSSDDSSSAMPTIKKGQSPKSAPNEKPPLPSTAATERAAASQQSAAQGAAVKNVACTGYGPKHAGLSSSTVPELRKLAEYEQLCGGAVASKVSFFVPTPSTVEQAHTSAAGIAGVLKAFARAGVAPLVFMEPNDLQGAKLDLRAYGSGAYDGAVDTYFKALQSAGVTSTEMGTWVFLPEGNLPVWSTTDPTIYAQVVTRTASSLKQHFPGSQAALMLDGKTYPVGETWGQGSYASLVPYVRSIPKGLIDSFGIQGFPWAGPANQPPSTLYDPKIFLRSDLAVEAARYLGVNAIWLNSGTFGRIYAGQPKATVSMVAADRQIMLKGITQQAILTKAQGFTVAIHVFAENKADLSEGIDWSYWHSPGDNAASAAAFSSFAADTTAAGIGIWLYDTAH
ncbi:MAG TPA: hypothetical protein VF575_03895 [Candidatus Saccharimonadales bacterium]